MRYRLTIEYDMEGVSYDPDRIIRILRGTFNGLRIELEDKQFDGKVVLVRTVVDE